MARFEVTALGVGDAFSELYDTSALLVEYDGFRLAIDCPDSYRRVLAKSHAKDVDHVLITHLHGDHVNGLEGYGFFKHFAEDKRLSLYASPEVLADIWPRRLAASMSELYDGQRTREMRFADYFDARALPWERCAEVGPFRIRTRRTLHHIPTTALFIEADGHSLGYSADTAFDPSLIEFLEPANVIVHETNLGPAHTPYEPLAELPAALREKMRLIHYPDFFDAHASTIRVLRQGDVLQG